MHTMVQHAVMGQTVLMLLPRSRDWWKFWIGETKPKHNWKYIVNNIKNNYLKIDEI